jgi:Raf kinase inhibitor-like YbhB/YbcL family protein
MLIPACSPAATPTPPLPPPSEGGVGGGQPSPTSPAATAITGQVETVPALPAATATAGQAGAAATLPAATSPAAASPPSPSPAGSPALTVTSAAFAEGASIPKQYSCDGESISPPLKWTGAPARTSSFVLIVDDPDAPSGTFTHWVAFDIPPTETEIPEGAKSVGKAGQNSAGRNGFIGPCPPSGTHRYFFTVYAIDVPSLNLNGGASRDQVRNAINDHILAEGKLMGRYTR